MWFCIILVEILSGLMLSNAKTDKITAAIEPERVENTTCGLGGPEVSGHDTQTPLGGCPVEIPLTREVKGKKEFVAARIYRGTTHKNLHLSCTGDCLDYVGGTKLTSSDPHSFLFPSMVVNPGCAVTVFPDYDFKGDNPKYFGTGRYPQIEAKPPLHDAGGNIPVAKSMFFTCTQVIPSCIPSDEWQIVATLDNIGGSVSATFSYLKTVGTTFSESISQSISVSATVKAEVEASFYGITASLGVSATTGYDWTSLDTEEKTTTLSYNVDVIVPAGLKIQIEEVLGTCGGSSVHTQMFRVVDSQTKETLHIVQGNLSNFVVSTEKIYSMGSTVASELGSGLGSCCPKKAIWGNMDPEKNGVYVNVGRRQADQIPKECNSPCVYVKQDSLKKLEYCFSTTWTSQSQCENMGIESGIGCLVGQNNIP